MSIYTQIYNNLCECKKAIKDQYGPGSNLHKHHIIPKHMGGSDDITNITYLTVKEHQIAHFLLWKMYNNPNDLRAMYMLGANLTYLQRKKVGEYCRDNRIGFFSPKYYNKRGEWRRKGIKTQINNRVGIHNPDNFKYHASFGGLVGSAIQIQNKIGIHTDDLTQRSKWASLGGKSHKGKRCMYKPGDATFKRVKKEDIDSYLKLGYIFGSPIKGKNQYMKD